MEYQISLEKLHFYAFHGVFDEEKKNGNEFFVTLRIKIPFVEEILDDDLTSTVSYADLYEVISHQMSIPRNLLEKVGVEIVNEIKAKFPQIKSGEITIEKCHPPIPGMLGSAEVKLIF